MKSALGVMCITACAVLAVQAGALHPLDDALSQWRFQLLKRPPSGALTVVEIDAESLKAAGTWPWGRDRFARAIENLNGAGARVVGLDVDFSARSSAAADAALAAAVRRWPGQVIMPTFVQAGREADGRAISTRPMEALTQDVVLASVNVPIDADGRVRRYKLGFDTAGGLRPSMASTLLGRPPTAGAFLIDYGFDANAVPRISFKDVYAGTFDPSLVRGRDVLIGSTAIELGDQFATPKRGILQGVYVHALAYESLRVGRALQAPSLPLLILCAALAAVFLRPRASADYGAALRRHLLVGGAIIVLPVVLQAWTPIAFGPGAVILTQVLSLAWLVRTELKRRADAVIQARETHLRQLADHMRESRDSIRAAHDELAVANVALDRALKARTDFLAMTSHEIRTPLNGVMGMTQVVLADQALPPEVREKIRLVHASGETMLALVEDLLDVAKMESGAVAITKAPMDLGRLLDETLAVWTDKAQAKGLRLKGDRAAAPRLIDEDAGRLRQILFNLLANAIKFTDTGEISLTSGVERSQAGDSLVFTVTDTGIGIAPDDLERIFEPFTQVDASTTRKYGGTGLGLPICRRLANAMGGELHVESALGAGSRFIVRLPLTEIVLPEGGTATTLQDARVLLVEANPLARGVLKAALSAQVAALEIVATLEEARQLIAARACDLVLIEGKALSQGEQSPAEALAAFASQAEPPRIAVLWAGEAEAATSLRAVGADLVVQKPIAAGELSERLGQLFAADAVADAA
ncbi:CHASE2 domain-containing protein [Caulobacter sp.]|uniref:CHASE2 domain-containing protein n=1 Tax=Caulobacter sp. TaxID=78 RepID=UPI001B15BB3D|nr:CHASE2 domain-containing protein [Caulobacter sp.]MBO9546964.1 CHASE2 domain-containing protein [Caulobacter sp.]